MELYNKFANNWNIYYAEFIFMGYSCDYHTKSGANLTLKFGEMVGHIKMPGYSVHLAFNPIL